MFSPNGPNTNVMRISGLRFGNCLYGLGQVLLLQVLGPLGADVALAAAKVTPWRVVPRAGILGSWVSNP